MSKRFKSERLILRQFEEMDAHTLYKLNGDPLVLKYTGDVPFQNMLEAKTFIQNYKEYNNNGFGRWMVIDRVSKENIGWCGLRKNENGITDVGFRFFQEYWGKGYATRSALFCLKIGFENFNLDEIIGRCQPENKGSIRVLEKIGMKKKGTENDENQSWFVYSIIQADFLKDSSRFKALKLESS